MCIWQTLKTRFSQSNIFRISYIEKELYQIQQDNLIVFDYFTKTKVMWVEIENYRPISYCKCFISCSYNVITLLQTCCDCHYVPQMFEWKIHQYQVSVHAYKPSSQHWRCLFLDHSPREREFDTNFLEVTPLMNQKHMFLNNFND